MTILGDKPVRRTVASSLAIDVLINVCVPSTVK